MTSLTRTTRVWQRVVHSVKISAFKRGVGGRSTTDKPLEELVAAEEEFASRTIEQQAEEVAP